MIPVKSDGDGIIYSIMGTRSCSIGIWSLYLLRKDSGDSAHGEQQQQQQQGVITRLIENIPGPIFLGVRDPLLPLNGFFSISLEIKKPLKIEQKQLWKYYLGKNYFYDIDNEISKLVSQFNLNASSILATTRGIYTLC